MRLDRTIGTWRKGAELDAWQASRLKGKALTHEQVYCDCVRRRLETSGARG